VNNYEIEDSKLLWFVCTSQKFALHKVFCLCCCRGHNELDNPSLTQPLMYKTIEKGESIPATYSSRLRVNFNTSEIFTGRGNMYVYLHTYTCIYLQPYSYNFAEIHIFHDSYVLYPSKLIILVQ